jgi:hypothetical protein
MDDPSSPRWEGRGTDRRFSDRSRRSLYLPIHRS